jgi:GNAT superfamily N-acetyltransferase
MIEYRQFQPDDAEQCSHFIDALCGEVARGSVEDFEELPADLRERVVALITKRTHEENVGAMYCIVAQAGDDLLGMGALDGSKIKRMYVHPSQRGHGIGTAIYKWLETEAYRRRLQSLLLTANLTATEFYTRLGFIRIGEKTYNPYGATLRFLTMKKEL